MQLQADVLHPLLQRGQHLLGAALALAVDQAVVGIALERAVRELPLHPRVERPVQEQVSDHGTDRRSLRGSPVPRPHVPSGMMHRGGQPPFHVKEHPGGKAQPFHGPDREILRHAAEERPDARTRPPSRTPSSASGATASASCAPRPGRYPQESAWKNLSVTVTIRFAATVCATRSATVGTPSILVPPALGISTAFTGGGNYVPADIRFQTL